MEATLVTREEQLRAIIAEEPELTVAEREVSRLALEQESELQAMIAKKRLEIGASERERMRVERGLASIAKAKDELIAGPEGHRVRELRRRIAELATSKAGCPLDVELAGIVRHHADPLTASEAAQRLQTLRAKLGVLEAELATAMADLFSPRGTSTGSL